jgi:hypothetical protein
MAPLVMPTNKRNVNAEGLATILPTIQTAAAQPSNAPATQRGSMFGSRPCLRRLRVPIQRGRSEARNSEIADHPR